MTDYIDGAQLRDMVLCAADALENNKKLINDLNVFPVPDGDTGTNMSLTIANACTELRKKNPETVEAVADVVAAAMLRGARGNSGVILSLLFRGMSKYMKGKKTADADDLARAMAEGVDAAYKAVMKPAEGTILTVSRVATKSAVEFAEAGSDLELMLVCALESAKAALKETVNQNPVLKRAGVIDAGGQGYVIILDAMLASLQGRAAAVFEALEEGHVIGADFSEFDTGEITFCYCTEFIVGRENEKSPELLLAYLQGIGDSVVVVDDDELIKTHVHTNDPGKVISEALTYGQLISVKIDNMRQQHTELGNAPESGNRSVNSGADQQEKRFGTVVVCAGKGMEKLFRELGADGIVTGGQTMNPSTEDILREIEATNAETVFVFPNNKNITMAAQQCAALSEKQVVIIPTESVPQGVSAMLAMDIYAKEEELTGALTEAVSYVHTALVTYASRDSEFDGHSIKAGEYLALLDGKLVGSFTDTEPLWSELNTRFEELEPEFVSVYYGEDVDESQAQEAVNLISAGFPYAEVSLINGGQPVYYYMIACE